MKTLSEEIIYSDVDPVKFFSAMQIEEKELNAKRFSYEMTKDSETVTFKIKASDEIAMKAAVSSIEKLHTIFKKMEGIKNE